MAEKNWLEEYGFNELVDKLGKGAPIGALVGSGAALLAVASGLGTGLGWLAWLIVPIAAMVGGTIGDYIKKDGPVFGEHGVVKAMGNHFKEKTIPEGYIAANVYADVSAVNSKALAKHGEVHMSGMKMFSPDEIALGYYEYRSLDPYVEFNIKSDPRLENLKAKAREYGKRYASKSSIEYITDTQERERTITNMIVEDIASTYGKYAKGVSDGTGRNSGEYESIQHPKRWLLGSKTVQLHDIQENEMVCRHYAPIASVLLHEASVPNHLICSEVGIVKKLNGLLDFGQRDDFDNLQPVSGHAYVVTDEGNAVVEATVAGQTYAKQSAYRPIINGVDVKNIVLDGKAAIISIPEGKQGFIYGGHNGAGGSDTGGGIETYRSHVMKAMRESMENHNKNVKAEKSAKEAAEKIEKSTEIKVDNPSTEHKKSTNDATVMFNFKSSLQNSNVTEIQNVASPLLVSTPHNTTPKISTNSLA